MMAHCISSSATIINHIYKYNYIYEQACSNQGSTAAPAQDNTALEGLKQALPSSALNNSLLGLSPNGNTEPQGN